MTGFEKREQKVKAEIRKTPLCLYLCARVIHLIRGLNLFYDIGK